MTLSLSLFICFLSWAGLHLAQGQSCLSNVHSYCGTNLCPPENRLILPANDPNDDDRCHTNFRNEPQHVFPEEWQVLFDTWDYTRLVGDGLMFLRRQFDNDGADNQWDEGSGTCTYTLEVCESSNAPQDNWVFSGHIKYPPSSTTLGGGHPTEVFFNVSYSFATCGPGLTCTIDYVTLYRYDRNSIASVADQTNRNNYLSTPLFGQGTDTDRSRLSQQFTGTSRTKRRLDSFTPPGSTGFHLGVRDVGTCGAVNRIIIYYIPCKEQQDGLVYYPELVRPTEGSPPNEAEACCVSNAHPTTSLTYRAYTVSDGRCERNVECECDAGYRLVGDGSRCEACPAGTYRSESDPQGTCLSCPQNTQTDAVAAPICQCIPNYFRNASDGAGAICATSPGPPGPPSCGEATGTTITIVWTAPTDTGGKPLEDIYYIIEHQAVSSTDGFIPSERVYGTTYTITGLEAITEHRINVISENSVSDQDTRGGIRTTRTVSGVCETGEGVPETPVGVQVVANSVLLWQPPAKPNGVIRGYRVEIVFNTTTGVDVRPPIDLDESTFVYVFLRGIPENSTATVTVRAKTSVGFGESSSPITFEPFAPVVVVDTQRVCSSEEQALFVIVTGIVVAIVTAAICLISTYVYHRYQKRKKEQVDSYDLSKNPGYANSLGLKQKRIN